MKDIYALGLRLSAEKDNMTILNTVLSHIMSMTCCDAGSIYIKEDSLTVPQLIFKVTANNSISFPFKEFSLPIDENSIAGYCALTGQAFNFATMEEVKDQIGITYNPYFDEQIGYRTCNMMVLPIKDLDKNTVGVVQLINKKTSPHFTLGNDEDCLSNITAFTQEDEYLVEVLTTYAAILYERNTLTEEVKTLLDSFIKGMVTAIDQRDPITSGHSFRVAKYAQQFAMALHNTTSGAFESISFTDSDILCIYYAGLLHDVGKIGIKEDILLKRFKLTEHHLEAIKHRLMTLYIQQPELPIDPREVFTHIKRINKSSYTPDEDIHFIHTLSQYTYLDMISNSTLPLLTKEEIDYLTVQKGNLTANERLSMEKHVENTYSILKNILWGKKMNRLPKIAAGHHEKLDGSGYYKGLMANEICLESRILAIVDIYEALTAINRPYKPAMPIDKALSILEMEGQQGKLDQDLVDFFIDNKLYELED